MLRLTEILTYAPLVSLSIILSSTLSAKGNVAPLKVTKTPVADLLAREGVPPTDNLLTCEQINGRVSCRLRDGDLSLSNPERLEQAALIRYRYTLECFNHPGQQLSLFAIRTGDQIRRLQYHASGLKSNVFGNAGSKVELVLFGDRNLINADIARMGCWRFTIDEVAIDQV